MLQKIVDDNIIGRMISDFKNINDTKNLISALRALIIIKGRGILAQSLYVWRENSYRHKLFYRSYPGLMN